MYHTKKRIVLVTAYVIKPKKKKTCNDEDISLNLLVNVLGELLILIM